MLKQKLTIIAMLYILTAGLSVQAEEIVLSVVPQFSKDRLLQAWQPIVEHIEKETGFSVRIHLDDSISRFENNLYAGKYHIAYANPLQYYNAKQKKGYTAKLRDIQNNLKGILVVRKDSPAEDIASLNQKTIAFPSPNALAASVLLRMELETRFKLKHKSEYVKSHDSVFLNVYLGLSDAGGAIKQTLFRQKPEVKNALRIIYETEEVPTHPLIFHPSMDNNRILKITEALLMLNDSLHGKHLLRKIPMNKIGLVGNEYNKLNWKQIKKYSTEGKQ